MINPKTLKLLGARALVKLYERPDKYGSILLPDKFKRDQTWTLWELVQATDAFEQELGVKFEVDDIIQTLKRIPVHIGCDEHGVDHFIMDANSCGFRGYTRWKDNDS